MAYANSRDPNVLDLCCLHTTYFKDTGYTGGRFSIFARETTVCYSVHEAFSDYSELKANSFLLE